MACSSVRRTPAAFVANFSVANLMEFLSVSRRRPVDVIDHQNVDRAFLFLQLEAKLFLHGGHKRWGIELGVVG